MKEKEMFDFINNLTDNELKIWDECIEHERIVREV